MNKIQLDEFVRSILNTARLNNVMVKSGFGVDEDTIFRLKTETIKFSELFVNVKTKKAELKVIAAGIEGLLLQCQTLGVLTKKQTESNIDQLHNLLDTK
jgi:hypothetical protein